MKCARALGRLAVTGVAALALLLPAPAAAERPDVVTCEELRLAMIEVVRTVEEARGLGYEASTALLGVDAALFDAIPDKRRFLEAAREIRLRSEAAKAAGAPPLGPLATIRPLVGSAPYAPNYPDPSLDPNYAVLQPLGLIQNPWDRCGGTGYFYYVAALVGADAALQASQLACDAASCDPTGIVCISVCGATKLVQAAYKLAAIPVVACNAWGVEVDSAENQAAFENTKIILGDLSAHDDRVMAKLGAQAGDVATLLVRLAALEQRVQLHDAEVKQRVQLHDAEIKQLLNTLVAQVVANQLEIIKLLKTPEGKRPGWVTEGYK